MVPGHGQLKQGLKLHPGGPGADKPAEVARSTAIRSLEALRASLRGALRAYYPCGVKRGRRSSNVGLARFQRLWSDTGGPANLLTASPRSASWKLFAPRFFALSTGVSDLAGQEHGRNEAGLRANFRSSWSDTARVGGGIHI